MFPKTKKEAALGMSILVVAALALIAPLLGVLHDSKSTAKGSPELTAEKAKVAELEAKLQAIADKQAADERLGQYVVNMMFKSPRTVKELSPAGMLSLAQDIVFVSNNIYDTEAERHGWIGALQIESAYLKFAQSPTGPKGLGQVARNTFHYALELCGVPSAHDSDVWDTKLNLYASACYFKEQLNHENGDIIAAIIDYNQGPEDEDAKSYPRNGTVKKPEPLKYVVKWTYNTTHTTDQKVPGVPAIGDLPRPVKPKFRK